MTDTAFYSDMQNTAHDLLADFGRFCLMKRLAEGEYDPDTGEMPIEESEESVTAAIFDFKEEMIDGSQILRGDRKAIVSSKGLSIVPQVGDELYVSENERYIVQEAKPLNPGGITVIYILQVRSK